MIGTGGVCILEFASWDVCSVSTNTSGGLAGGSGGWVRETIQTDRDDMFAAEQDTFLRAAAAGRRVPADYSVEAAAQAVAIVRAGRADAEAAAAEVPVLQELAKL